MGAESFEKKEIPAGPLNNKICEVGLTDSWEGAFEKVLDAIHMSESRFTFNQLKVINENFPKIEKIMKKISALGTTLEDNDKRNVLCAEKAELIGELPKDYDIREIVARITEVTREDIDRVYEMQDKKRLREYEDKAKE